MQQVRQPPKLLRWHAITIVSSKFHIVSYLTFILKLGLLDSTQHNYFHLGSLLLTAHKDTPQESVKTVKVQFLKVTNRLEE